MGKNAKLKEKQKWSEEKIHLDNARKLRGIYFIDPEDKEFKETIKNARKKLETSVAPAMPCKIMKNCGSGGSDKNKTKLACILEANESTRMRMGDIISRLPGCDGQAADAVSANTQVKMEDAHKLLKIPKSECPDIWIRLPRHKWPKSWSSMEDPVVPLERNLYGHPLAGLLWERQFEKVLLKHGWEKIPNWECLFVHREKGLFLSVYVDDIKLAGKKHNIDPMWKVLNKEVDLGEPTSFLDHVYLGCTQRQCEISKDIVDNYRTMFESRISAGGLEKLPFPQNIRISSWSYDMAGHARKCVERYCELANKTTQQLHKVSTPCIDDHHFKEEETKSVGELSNTCSQIVLKCLYLARIGRPDIL